MGKTMSELMDEINKDVDEFMGYIDSVVKDASKDLTDYIDNYNSIEDGQQDK